MHTLKPTRSTGIIAAMFVALLALPANSAPEPRPGDAASSPAAATTLDTRHRGIVAPSKQVLIASPLDAIVSNLAVKKGAVVKAGDLLAGMDDEVQKLVVLGAKLKADSIAKRRVAELALEQSKLEVEKAQDLFKQKAIPEWELRQKIVIMKTKEAEMEAAKEEATLDGANWKLEEERLKRFQILAPFAGTVLDIVAEQGASMARGDKMLVLAALDTLQARINLPVSLSRLKLQVGKQYRLVASGSITGEVIGTLTFVRNADDPGSDTYYCEFDIPNPDLKMPAGFSVDLVWPQ